MNDDFDASGLIDKRIGHFRLLREQGRGGMGVVYLALDEKLDRRVVLKVLPSSVSADPERRKRFMREARLAAAVHHPNIATVFEVGESEGHPYIAMEFVEGDSLRSLLASGAMPPNRALAIARDILNGLSSAHRAGVTHRDLKPENVMVTTEGTAKLLDFGIAKALAQDADQQRAGDAITETGQVLGTPGYMAPEQATGQPVDQRADVFAIGVLLYEMLSGRAPFSGSTPMERMASVLRDTPPLVGPDTSVPEIDRFFARCLAKRPEDRFGTASEVLEALNAVEPSVVRSMSNWHRTSIDPYAETAATPALVAGAIAQSKPPEPRAATLAGRLAQVRPWIAALLFLAIGGGAFAWWSARQNRTASASEGALAEARARARDARDRAEAPALAPSRAPSRQAESAVWPCEKSSKSSPDFDHQCSAEQVAWCDREWKQIACCAKGLVANGTKDTCACPPGGATNEAAIASGCKKADVKPGLHREQIQRVVRKHHPEFKACYEQTLAKGEKPRGSVDIAVRISPSGRVFSTRIQGSSLPAPETQTCLVEVWQKLEFPPPAGAGGVTVTYPLSFSPD